MHARLPRQHILNTAILKAKEIMITYKVRDQVCQIYNPARRRAETGDTPSH